MTVTWTSGYGISDAEPFVEWGQQGEEQTRSPAVTLTFDRNTMCGMENISLLVLDVMMLVHLIRSLTFLHTTSSDYSLL